MPKWEYLIEEAVWVEMKDEDGKKFKNFGVVSDGEWVRVSTLLATVGEQGWELTSTVVTAEWVPDSISTSAYATTHGTWERPRHRMYFKRLKED